MRSISLSQDVGDESEAGAVWIDLDTKDDLARHASFCASGYAAVRLFGYDDGVALMGCDSDELDAGEHWEAGKAAAMAMLSRPEVLNAVGLTSRVLHRDGRVDPQLLPVFIDFAKGEISDDDLRETLELFGIDELDTRI